MNTYLILEILIIEKFYIYSPPKSKHHQWFQAIWFPCHCRRRKLGAIMPDPGGTSQTSPLTQHRAELARDRQYPTQIPAKCPFGDLSPGL